MGTELFISAVLGAVVGFHRDGLQRTLILVVGTIWGLIVGWGVLR